MSGLMMADGKSYTIVLDYDNETGDVIMPLPDELMKEAGWNLGDDLEWIDNENGTYTLKKVENKEWVLVECVSQFRMRYMVQVPAGKAEWALDTVVMNEAKEFSQEHIGETIVSHRVVTTQEALELCDIDNAYCSSWNEEQKMKTFFTRDGEKVEPTK
jgi:bifunctional DNA-binding transcriptional regulator/antitoxin component of YhaV-PrlF toxin-antitoxin module